MGKKLTVSMEVIDGERSIVSRIDGEIDFWLKDNTDAVTLFLKLYERKEQGWEIDYKYKMVTLEVE